MKGWTNESPSQLPLIAFALITAEYTENHAATFSSVGILRIIETKDNRSPVTQSHSLPVPVRLLAKPSSMLVKPTIIWEKNIYIFRHLGDFSSKNSYF